MAARVRWNEKRGVWWLVEYVPGQKNPTTKSFGPTDEGKAKADRICAELNKARADAAEKAEASKFRVREPIPADAALWAWFDLVSPAKPRNYVRGKKLQIEKYLAPHFKQFDLRELTSAHIIKFAGTMGKTVSAETGRPYGWHTIIGSVSTLRIVLNWLEEQRHLEFRPLRKICATAAATLKGLGIRAPEAEAYSREEAEQLMTTLQGRTVHDICFAALHTGCRKGELLGLDWKNVHLDVEKPYFRVIEVLTEENLIKDHPKTDNSIRNVWLNPEVAELFRRMRRARKAAAQGQEPMGRVFRNSRGRPWSYCGIDTSWQTARDLAVARHDIPKLDLHGFRHTYASWALNDPTTDHSWLARQMGDNITTLLKTYTHLTERDSGDHSFILGPRTAAASSLRLAPEVPAEA